MTFPLTTPPLLGIGSDLCDIRRIEAAMARFPGRLIARICTEVERARVLASPRPAAALAKRFAAKEACAKALGTGFRGGIGWRDIEIMNLPSGQPEARLHGAALARMAALSPAARMHLTITDEYPYAFALAALG